MTTPTSPTPAPSNEHGPRDVLIDAMYAFRRATTDWKRMDALKYALAIFDAMEARALAAEAKVAELSTFQTHDEWLAARSAAVRNAMPL